MALWAIIILFVGGTALLITAVNYIIECYQQRAEINDLKRHIGEYYKDYRALSDDYHEITGGYYKLKKEHNDFVNSVSAEKLKELEYELQEVNKTYDNIISDFECSVAELEKEKSRLYLENLYLEKMLNEERTKVLDNENRPSE